MKTMFLTAVFSLCFLALHAQSITVSNGSNCTVNYYLAATDATCSTSASTINYAIAPGASVTFNFGSATWTGTTPGAGWQWQFIKEWNGCGPYSFAFPSCSGGVNQNVCGVGIPCSGLANASCMVMNTMCNTCSGVKTQWFPTGGGNVAVRIW